jgi:lipopolysaccharide assembly protein A
MQIYLILALAIAIIAVIFALQNMTTVTISILFWSVKGSLALVLLVALAAGVLISVLVSLPGLIGGKWASSSQKKKLGNLESERNKYQEKAEAAAKEVEDLQAQLKDVEEQLANLSAAYELAQIEKPAQSQSESPGQTV